MARLPQRLAKAPVGRARLSREELDRHQRRRLLEAATTVFARRGYPASTVDNIVAAADVGVGTFYAHFDGKEACLLAAYAEIVSEVRARIAAKVEVAAGGWTRKALAALHELLELIAAEPLRARVALVEIQTGGPTALARYAETTRFAIDALAGGREVLEVSPAPSDTQEAASVHGLAWLLSQQILHGEAREVPALFAEMAELMLDPYLGAPATRREIARFEKALAAG